MRWFKKQLGRKGFPFGKKFCIAFASLFFLSFAFFVGYATHFTDTWLESSPCDRADIGDLNPFTYKNPEALSDRELACLLVKSKFPRKELENAFKHVYCESSKIPHADTRFGGKVYYGLFHMSEDHATDFGLSSPKIFYVPKEAMNYAHQLWEKREWQPWFTDSTKKECIELGPNMDGDNIRDGWEWAEPTFATYFGSDFDKLYAQLKASID